MQKTHKKNKQALINLNEANEILEELISLRKYKKLHNDEEQKKLEAMHQINKLYIKRELEKLYTEEQTIHIRY